jgi:hypothetical protein
MQGCIKNTILYITKVSLPRCRILRAKEPLSTVYPQEGKQHLEGAIPANFKLSAADRAQYRCFERTFISSGSGSADPTDQTG